MSTGKAVIFVKPILLFHPKKRGKVTFSLLANTLEFFHGRRHCDSKNFFSIEHALSSVCR